MDEDREARRVASLELARLNLARPAPEVVRREPPPLDALARWRAWKPPEPPEKRGPTDSQLARMIGELRDEMHATVAAHKAYIHEYVNELLVLVVSDIDHDIADAKAKDTPEIGAAEPQAARTEVGRPLHGRHASERMSGLRSAKPGHSAGEW